MNKTSVLVGGAVLMLAACVPEGDGEVDGRLGVAVPEVDESSPMALMFEEAADEFDVPVDLLKAISFYETQLEPAAGAVEFEGQPAPYGLFALRGDELQLASFLIGSTVEEVMSADDLNVRAAAALLSTYADDAGIPRDARGDVTLWKDALEKMGDLDDDMRPVFSNEILSIVSQGLAVPLADGTTMIIGRHAEAQEMVQTTSQGLRSSLATWLPSPNHSSRGSYRPEIVVIHTCEGAYSGCVSWLRQSRSRVSAHYVVNESGSQIAQLVDESRKAWHISATYRSSLNSGRLSNRNGVSSNNFSVGIEHGGRAAQRTWPAGQITASVELVRDITARNNIPRDRYHIVAHGQLQPESRTDPGPNWPWSSYLQRIASGSTPPPPPTNPPPTNPPPSTGPVVTVDNTDSGRFRASGSWDLSSWASGKVGSNYRFRSPAFTSDPAEYKVALGETGNYEVFARVPGNGYNTNVPYVIQHASGSTTVHRNISDKGGQWVSLGTYRFAAGDAWRVLISCWTNGRGYLIADAIRFEKR